MLDAVVTGGRLFDGLGGQPIDADVAIAGGRIVEIGRFDASDALIRLDAAGAVVAPGFVDIHSHSDLTLLADGRAPSKVRQGVTTEVVGNCGFSPFPVSTLEQTILAPHPSVAEAFADIEGYADALIGARPALNVVPLVGHVALRVSVGGSGAEPLDAAGRGRLADALDGALAAGAGGVSTGLMYPPAMYADTDELLVLGAGAARHGVLFALHMRNYSTALLPAVGEAIAIARATGCRIQLSHLAVAGRRNWGSVQRALDLVDAARAEGVDIGVDIYPYLAGSANLSQLLPAWAQEGGAGAIVERLGDPGDRQRIVDAWQADRLLGWDEVELALVDPDLEDLLGLTVEEVARRWDSDPDEAAMELIRRTEDRVLMVAHGRSEVDLLPVLRHPAASIGSDGLAMDPARPTGAGRPHPRSYGCYPRFLGTYVRDRSVVPLETAIEMCTSRPADRLGLGDRGRIAPGAAADLTIFEPAALMDHATFRDPGRFAEGLRWVLVNGEVVVDHDTQVDDARPGQVLLRR